MYMTIVSVNVQTVFLKQEHLNNCMLRNVFQQVTGFFGVSIFECGPFLKIWSKMVEVFYL